MLSSDHVIRILVVDDSAFMRRAIRSMIEAAADMQVIAVACNGIEAVEQAGKLKPDVITLDIEMPQMDGLTALRQIRRVCGAAVLMVSSLTAGGSAAALSAMRMGASDVIAKDVSQVSLNIVRIQDELQQKIRAIARKARTAATELKPDVDWIPHAGFSIKSSDIDLVVIGSSTGGPPVLEQLAEKIPGQLDVPIVIAQHMPRIFTAVMAERLESTCAVPVIHGEHGMLIERGKIYICPGESHTRLHLAGVGRFRLEVSQHPREALYRPSVNELFASAARVCGKRCLAIMLTGMGDDGLIGSRALHEAGAPILAQDCESCVVYGMPKAVTEAGLITASLDPARIAAVLATLVPREALQV